MKIDQMDIPINDFTLRIKSNGTWIRLDTSCMNEADDYCLDFEDSDEVIALCMLKDKYEKEYNKIINKRKKLKGMYQDEN